MKSFGAIAAICGLLLLPNAAFAGPTVTPLVSTDWLSEHLDAEDLVILDYRSARAFETSHIPGSVHTEYPGLWRATMDGVPWALPELGSLEALLSDLGVDAESSVIVIPEGSGSTELGGATWIYWVLTSLGHDAVAILDGGWNAWSGEGRVSEGGDGADINPTTFVARPTPAILASTGFVRERLSGETVIVDARPFSQYVGETQSELVTRAGHIPGAISLDNARFYDADTGRLRPLDALEAELPPELSDRSVAVISYCNTGHWSSINWFVLHELLSFEDVRLYEGSMAAWTRDPELPVVSGGRP